MDGRVRVCERGVDMKTPRHPINILFWCHPKEEIASGMQSSEGPTIKGLLFIPVSGIKPQV